MKGEENTIHNRTLITTTQKISDTKILTVETNENPTLTIRKDHDQLSRRQDTTQI